MHKPKKLIKRVLELSKKYKCSHIGSCISALSIIDEIYKKKKRLEPFILSCGHAFLAQCVVMEKYKYGNAEKIFKHHGTHPDRCKKCKLDYSTGSLGHGLGAAIGMALAKRNRNVYCLLSDGECMEGSIWEALRLKTQLELHNLKIYVNINGYSALSRINEFRLATKLRMFDDTIQLRMTDYYDLPFLNGVDAHYITI